jgi:hypothetical protein
MLVRGLQYILPTRLLLPIYNIVVRTVVEARRQDTSEADQRIHRARMCISKLYNILTANTSVSFTDATGL